MKCMQATWNAAVFIVSKDDVSATKIAQLPRSRLPPHLRFQSKSGTDVDPHFESFILN